MRFKLFGVFAALALMAQTATPQTELKQVMTTVADTGDPVRMTAFQIEKNWTDSTIHLMGQVRLVMGKFSASGGHPLVITADEVTLNERTGEVIPNGHVRIAPYPSH